ncbi:sulfatase [Candidatus Fermentibacteria bacterium]|nr:sulfatase [Candidatus Fermentibacteria bacterium]
MKSLNSVKERMAIGWVTGLVLAVLETGRAGIPAGSLGWGMALVALGMYPLLGGLASLALGVVPWLRPARRLTMAVIILMVVPWAVSVIFPHLSLAGIRNPLQWPRIAAVLVGALMSAGWAGRRHGLLVRLFPPVPVASTAGAMVSIAGVALLVSSTQPARVSLRADGKGPNVVLISLDTVRKDALGCYGGPASTPALDSLAAAGLRFRSATSCAPWTLASVSSFMTGYHPSTTGVFTGVNRLAEEFETLGDVFSAQGYHTHAIVTNAWLRPQFGLSQGFAVYDHRTPVEPPPELYSFAVYRAFRRCALRPPPHPPESASDVVSRALQFLGSKPPTPFFLWLHFNDAHDPYSPPRRYIPQRGSYRGPFRATSGRIVRLREGNRLSFDDRRRIQALYHAEVEYLDTCLRGLFAGLRDAGLDRHTIVAVVADHGEEFWEHGSVGHGHTLHGELLQVPFILSFPGHVPDGAVSDIPTTLADLAPTIRYLAGVPESMTQGRALTDTSRMPAIDRPLFAEALEFFWELKSITLGKWKLILDPASGDTRLFDTADDPWERFDVSRENPLLVSALRDTLTAGLSRFGVDADRMSLARGASVMVLSPQLREQLRAQGYVE